MTKNLILIASLSLSAFSSTNKQDFTDTVLVDKIMDRLCVAASFSLEEYASVFIHVHKDDALCQAPLSRYRAEINRPYKGINRG